VLCCPVTVLSSAHYTGSVHDKLLQTTLAWFLNRKHCESNRERANHAVAADLGLLCVSLPSELAPKTKALVTPPKTAKPLTKPQEAATVVNKKQPAATNTPKATSPVAPGAPKDAARNLLQWGGWGGGGWSGSQSQAQAQAQSQGWGGGGWGGSGSQGECFHTRLALL